MIIFCKKIHQFGHPRLGKQFVHPYWLVDPKVGCSKLSNLLGACKAKSNLSKELDDIEFEEEIEREEFLNLCDFPN
jgi:hypothetical protein